jgi:hypothetical protein
LKIGFLWREPLLHFLLIGLLLFLIYGKVAPPSDDGNRVTVTQADIAALARQFQATWSRPPTPDELKGLVDSHVRDEILFREGTALGLLEGDTVIKRRVRQKLEVLIEESGKSVVADDAELASYLERNPDAFRVPPVLDFEQVLFDAASSDADAERAIAAALAALNAGASAESQGRRSLLPGRVDGQPLDLIAREFGDDFATALETAPIGQWTGPIGSGFGLHLVRISERVPGYVPGLDEARAAVTREWENERRKTALAEYYARLLKEYQVEIEAADAPAPAP